MTEPMTAVPPLLDDEVARTLRATLRSLLARRSPSHEDLLAADPSQWGTPELMTALGDELDLAGLLVPADLGGAGAGVPEAAVVAAELGRVLAPVPFLESAVLATVALLDTRADDLLALLASGRRTATLAVPAATWPGAPFPGAVRAHGHGERVGLTGEVPAAFTVDGADFLVVPARSAGRPVLAVVEPAAAGDAVGHSRLTALDITRPLVDLSLQNCPARIVARGANAEAALLRALRTGAAVLAAEQLAVAERCLELTVAYLRTRHQFGRPIGSFQALRHRAADLWARLDEARAAAQYAAVAAHGDGTDLPIAAAVAQSHCGDLAVQAAEECLQMHGGIGFTWEHPLHLYLKRAISQLTVLGTPERHRADLAGLIALTM